MASVASTKDFDRWLAMMRKHSPHIREDGFHALQPHARQFVGPLVAAFESETDHGLRCWLLELLGDARDPQLAELFIALLDDPDPSISWWATRGLQNLAPTVKDVRREVFERGIKRAGQS
jgi:hypothetical protein